MTTPLFAVVGARVVVIHQALVFIRFTVCCQIKDLYEQKPTRTQPNAAPFSLLLSARSIPINTRINL